MKSNVPGKGIGSSFFIFLLIGLSFVFPVRGGFSQGFQIRNPADRSLPWASENNPAIISFQNSQIAVGLKIFHLGFLPENALGIRENQMNLTLPFFLPYEFGLGADLRYFSTSIYSEIAGSLLLSREIYPQISLGFKAGFERRGFNRETFHILDADDPLLAKGLASVSLNLGFGVYWQPGKWRLGLGVDHVNRPDIGLLKQAIFPREISLAAGYHFGRITPTILIHDDGTKWRFGFFLAAVQSQVGSIRLGYENSLPVKIEASLNLSKNNRLRYSLDLPGQGTRGASAGIQELDYTQILGRAPEIGQPEILFTSRQLKILEETVVRSMPADLQLEELKQSPELAPDYLTPAAHPGDMLVVIAGPLNNFETREGKIGRWQKLVDQISLHLQEDAKMQAFLLANEASIEDARIIKQAVVRREFAPRRIRIARLQIDGQADLRGFKPGRVTLQRKRPHLSAQKLGIILDVPGKTRRTNGWLLVIRNAEGKAVAQFGGKGKLPEQLEWDWRDNQHRLISPGEYFCDLRLRTTADRKRFVVSQPFKVVLIKRRVKFQFKNDYEIQTSNKKEPVHIGEL